MSEKKMITGIALQGGGALGAYELGALKALYQIRGEDFQPRVVAGISIGAINGAILLGAKNDPVGTLEEVWRERFCLQNPISQVLDMFRPWYPKPTRAFINQFEKNLSFYGNPGMYRFNSQAFCSPFTCTSIYDTRFLEKTFQDFIDLKKLNQPDTSRLIVTAINVRTGDQQLFDNGSMALDFRHIMASGSFPVTFPMTEIDGEIYWDGGIFINTPAAPAINALEMIDSDNPDVERELIYIEVHRRAGEIPCNLRESLEKCYALIFSGKFSLDGKLAKKLNSLMDFFDEMDRILPEDHPLRKHEVYKYFKMHRRLNRRITIGQSGRGAIGSSHDFSRSTIERRIEDGFNDAMEILTKAESS